MTRRLGLLYRACERHDLFSVFTMRREDLINAIRNSGGHDHVIEEVDTFWPRIELINRAGRYQRLLRELARANNKSNFLALLLEANFAYRFESVGKQLTYEVRPAADDKSSVDFLRVLPSGDHLYLELRLLQEAEGLETEADEIVRIQSTILSKVQKPDGAPTKFLSTDPNAVNVVVIDASANMLGMLDFHDCVLATHGDAGVEEIYRRQVFGLFQEDRPNYPSRIHEIAAKYAYIRSVLHGVLFLFRPEQEMLTYDIQQYLIWNPLLMTDARARAVYGDIAAAVPLHRPDRD